MCNSLFKLLTDPVALVFYVSVIAFIVVSTLAIIDEIKGE